jgi:hypothetical protein
VSFEWNMQDGVGKVFSRNIFFPSNLDQRPYVRFMNVKVGGFIN